MSINSPKLSTKISREIRYRRINSSRTIFAFKNIKQIISEGENVLKFEPKSKQTLEVLLVAYAKIGDISNSLIHLNKMKNLKYINTNKYKNISADLNYLSALNNLDNNKNKKAINHLKEAVKQKPGNIPACIKLTDLLSGIGSKSNQ